MFPVIAAIGPFTISSLGVFLALAFFFGSFSIWRRAKEEHYEDEDIFDAIFMAFFGGIIVARVLYILLHFQQFGLIFTRWINLAYSNQFSWLGFLAGAMYLLKLVCKKKKWNFFLVADLSVFGVLTAQILVRIGQFLDGSYIGSVTSLPWGMVFPGVEGSRHPLPLYELILLLGTYFLLRWLDKHYRLFSWYQDNRGEAKPGILWLTYLGIFILGQFILDFFSIRTVAFLVFSFYQILLLVSLIAVGLTFWVRAGNKITIPGIKDWFSSNASEEAAPIREPMSEFQTQSRPRRFIRARASKS